jgi:hypothetical protein
VRNYAYVVTKRNYAYVVGARAITQEFLEEDRYLGGDGVGGDDDAAAVPTMRAG